MWLPDDDLSFEKLKEAQQRYEDHLIGAIPEGTRRVLDVGCGTAAMVQRLLAMGFEVEGLSPDEYQQKLFAKRVSAPFHHRRFEGFRTDNAFDCIIMSESAQYIGLRPLLRTSSHCLVSRGHLLVCDHFVSKNASGGLAKGGHDLEAFMAEARAKHFALVRQEDITDSVTKTLDMAKRCVDKALLAVDIATEKHRVLSRIARWLFRKRIAKLTKSLDLLDSEKFKASKQYLLLLLRYDRG
jgi:cyclopropane fatty-acyl-phospholipid synthase-like methyltransferase